MVPTLPWQCSKVQIWFVQTSLRAKDGAIVPRGSMDDSVLAIVVSIIYVGWAKEQSDVPTMFLLCPNRALPMQKYAFNRSILNHLGLYFIG
jgi:hypothetical protein